jgi:small subunit ribosomal protein S8
MLNDPLANALSMIMNAESRSRKSCTITPVSKIIKKVLTIMNNGNYIGKFTETETARGNVLSVDLLGAINKCGAVKPRYAVKNNDFEKFEKKFLPAKDFGFIIVSTPQGVMTHIEAKQKSLGGRLIAYFY